MVSSKKRERIAKRTSDAEPARAMSRARRSAHAILAVVLVVTATLGCRRQQGAHVDAGSEGSRVVSLSPNTTEALFAIGAGAQVVGRSRYCDHPPEVSRLPQVGGYVDPNLEAILALRPTLVTGARGPAGAAIAHKLEDRGVATFFPPTETFREIDAMLLGVGARTGHSAEASKAVEDLHRRLEAIDAALRDTPRPRILVIFGLEPVSVAGPQSFVDEMIRHAHAENVVHAGGTYPTLGVERVLSLDPDVVVNAAMAEAYGKPRIDKTTPGWSKVRAVQTDHVVSLDDENLLRPGPRIADGVLVLARALHPDVRLPLPGDSP